MEKEEYLKHREASTQIANAYMDLVKVIRSAPDDTCITVGIERKGGRFKDISLEYLAVVPFIESNGDYDRIWRREAERLNLLPHTQNEHEQKKE
jgi:hypothetical protein